MTTPSGQISLSNVNTELGNTATAMISLNDSAVRSLASVPSGAISMANLQNKTKGYVLNVTLSANTTDYNMRAAAVSAGWNQTLPLLMTVTVNSGVYVYASATGNYAFQTGSTFPSGTTLTLVNNGVIEGAGGSGGGSQASGASAGPALLASQAISITNNGTIGGGGGGGGGGQNGAGYTYMTYVPKQGQQIVYVPGASGGGGGGGQSNGAGGSPNGNAGTLSSAGSGGASGGGGAFAGGSGGTLGSSGAAGGGSGGSGGSAGAAIAGNTNITWVATGTRLGAIA